jgi:hypothetical protein
MRPDNVQEVALTYSHTVTPDANTITPGLTRGPFSMPGDDMKNQNGFRIKSGTTCAGFNVTPDANIVTPGLTRGPFSKLGNNMKEQNGFRIKSGTTCAQLTTVRTQ